jgi:hypothetical protein
MALLTAGLSALRPRYCSNGMIRNASDEVAHAHHEQAVRSRRGLPRSHRRVQLPVCQHVTMLDQIVMDHRYRGHSAERSQRGLGQQQVKQQ